jgi:hypothetical protein
MDMTWFTIHTEYERGWGQRVEMVNEWLDRETAEGDAHSTNRANVQFEAPDCYWSASVSNDTRWRADRHYKDCRTLTQKPRIRVKAVTEIICS